jgi:hypothetical protein
VSRRSSIRASDADRESVAERLREAAGEGRILAHELEDRLAKALRAQTYGDLDAVVDDLLGVPAKRRGSRGRELARSHPIGAVALLTAVALSVMIVTVMLAIVFVWFMTWGVWLLVVLAALTLRGGSRGRHSHGRGYGPPPGRYASPRRGGFG